MGYPEFETAGIPIIEVGHGNGLGASSLQLGESLVPDEEIFKLASETLRHTKVGIHVITGVATINDLKAALDLGMDVVSVASHCTEADITVPLSQNTHPLFLQGNSRSPSLIRPH